MIWYHTTVTYKTPLILVTAAVTVFGFQNFKSGQVLSQTIEITPAPFSGATVTLSVPTNTPTPTVTPRPTRIPTPTVKPQPEFSSEQIYGFTETYGHQYGVDPNVIRHIALCESTFKSGAKNYRPYCDAVHKPRRNFI